MPIAAADLFVATQAGTCDGPDTEFEENLDTARLAALITGPAPAHTDVDVSLALMNLVRDDLHLSGTSGDQRLAGQEMRAAVRALERTTDRAGQPLRLPFRDHTSWKSYWIRRGASGTGGWRPRRSLLAELSDQPYTLLMAAQDRALASTLA